MTIAAHTLASGPGWSVDDIVCTAGPGSPRFEERHGSVSIAAVLRGSFQYRTGLGRATLVPGAVLLGSHGACYECGHDHSSGDHCLAFHFSPEYYEEILASVAGARRFAFTASRLPPLTGLIPLIAEADAARDDPAALEEIALRFAGRVAALLASSAKRSRPPSRRDEARIGEALWRIEADIDKEITLADLAGGASMSPYHFLRVFRAVTGITPHQFVLAERLRNAAKRLRRTDDAVSAIAWDVGFGDLSTFNRRFRAIMGASPTAYRSGASRSGGIVAG